MTTFRILFPVLVIICTSATQQSLSVLDTADIIAAHGYPSETHHVTTSDGYILEMHRIPHGIGQTPSAARPVVFLMHGLLAASNSYILLGSELSPAFNVADGGFDVWLGNARGNRNSRFHVSLDPDHPTEKFDFFDFSFEEIALRDLPAMIDYVLQYTGHEKLHYIGHSQGGTVFLILNSMLPEYNDKIKSAHLLAGVGYLPLRILFMYNLTLRVGFVEVFPPRSTDGVPADARFSHCTGDEKTSYLCDLIAVRHLMNGVTQTDSDLEYILGNLDIGGAAMKQIAHYGQNVRDRAFRRWSYGTLQNLIVYGTSDPPAYDLGRITINTTMHYTVSDILLDEKDVLAMANDMPNTVVRKVAKETFGHADFVMASDAKELVTDYILEALRRDSALTDTENNVEEADQNPKVDVSTESPGNDSAHVITLNNVLKMYLILLSFCLYYIL